MSLLHLCKRNLRGKTRGICDTDQAAAILKIGSFSNDDGKSNENVVVKWEFALLYSLCEYSKHFNVTKVWQTLKKETYMNGAQFRRENENLSSSADVHP